MDKKQLFSPFQPINKQGKCTFSDHYSILFTLRNMPLRQQTSLGTKRCIWNTNKDDGWSTYKERTTENPILDKIANSEIVDVDTAAKEVETELNKCKYTAFGKVKLSSASSKENKEVQLLMTQKQELLKDKNNDVDKIKVDDSKMTTILLKEKRHKL